MSRPLADVAAGLRSGAITALELYEEAKDAHHAYGDNLNAYRVWDETGAWKRAKEADAAFKQGRDAGPLQGVPVSVKDLFGLSGFDTYAGSPKPLPDKWSQEGPFIRAVLDQGAVITGKTHQVEFAFGGLGTNAHWPIPRNPWDAEHHRVSGGSSSGAGVSLIEGSCLIALGSDTAGSVRVPASMTGTVGLKVTAGRWPLEGIVPLSPTLDTPGVLARSVADAALVFSSIDRRCGKGRGDVPIEAADLKSLRIGLCDHYFWEGCPDDIAGVVRDALKGIEKAGAEIVSLELPETDEAFELFKRGSVVSAELMAFLKRELSDWIDTLDPNIAYRVSDAPGLDSEEIARRRARLGHLAGAAERRFKEIDVLVSPTVPITAPKLEDVADVKAYSAANGQALRNTCIANILGLCALTLPVGLDKAGIPVGLQLMARGNEDTSLLAAGLAAEKCLGSPRERLGPPPLDA